MSLTWVRALIGRHMVSLATRIKPMAISSGVIGSFLLSPDWLARNSLIYSATGKSQIYKFIMQKRESLILAGLLKNLLHVYHFPEAQNLNNLRMHITQFSPGAVFYMLQNWISHQKLKSKQWIEQKFWTLIPKKGGLIGLLILISSFPKSPIHHITVVVVVIFIQNTDIPVSSLLFEDCFSPEQWVAWRPPGRLPGPGAGLLSCRRSWGSNLEAVALAPGWHQSHTEDPLQAMKKTYHMYITSISHEHHI